ncbi:MAG: hypothetical protein AB8I08_09440 [Sandaracinaceae bacterium]
MRACLAIVVLTLLGCGASSSDSASVDPPAAETEAPASADPAASPWTVRVVRTCNVWTGSMLLGTQDRLFACSGAQFDAETTALLHSGGHRYPPRELASLGTLAAWTDPNEGYVAVDDGVGPPRRTTVEDEVEGGAFSPDGTRLAFGVLEGVRVLDRAAGRVSTPEGAERCANTRQLGFDARGRVQCAVRSEEGGQDLVTLGSASVRLPNSQFVRWLPNGAGIVTRDDAAIAWRASNGSLLAEHAAPTEYTLLSVGSDGSALIATEGDGRGEYGSAGRTERWWRDGSEVRTEVVYPHSAYSAVYVGDEIALRVFDDVIWLHRGAPFALPELPLPEAPEGYLVYETTDAHTYEGERGTFARALNDVVMFGPRGEGALLRVSRSDAAELARYTDLDGWARAAMARYLEPGNERWAKAFHDDDGNRVMRGHSYIGGCERAHVDVLVRERGTALERWRAYGSAPTTVGPLGRIPDDAHDIEDGVPEGYAGDPSIGPL